MEPTENRPVDNPLVLPAKDTAHADDPAPIEPLSSVASVMNQSKKQQESVQPAPDITENITQPDKPAKIVPVPEDRKVTPLDRLGGSPDWIDCPWYKRMTKTRIVEED